MSKNATWTVLAVIILVAIGAFIYMNGKNVPATDTTPTNDTSAVTNDSGATVDIQVGAGATVTTGAVKEFTVSGESFAFTPNTLSVKKGDTVKITFKNVEGFHDFKIDEFNVATAKIGGGKEETITFVADKAGQFQYYCSVGEHRAKGMLGTLTVSE